VTYHRLTVRAEVARERLRHLRAGERYGKGGDWFHKPKQQIGALKAGRKQDNKGGRP